MVTAGATRVAAALLACVWVANAQQDQTSLLVSPGPGVSALYMQPVVYNHTMEGCAGGGSSFWSVAQWNNPQQLGTNVTVGEQGPCSRAGVEWYIAGESMRVCMYTADGNGQHAVELAQSGDSGLKCGLELDSFVSPTTHTYTNVPLGETDSDALDTLASLNLTFGFELPYAVVKPRCGSGNQCGGSGHVDYGYATAAMTFDNKAKQQSLFYQIMLWDSRSSSECNSQPCRPGRNWFFKSQPYGVSDNIASYGQPCISSPGLARTFYNLDVLPMVSDAIRQPGTGVDGLDSDLSHWYQSGMYIGVGLQGSATQTCVIDSVNIVQTSNT